MPERQRDPVPETTSDLIAFEILQELRQLNKNLVKVLQAPATRVKEPARDKV